MERYIFQTYRFAIVVCRNSAGQFLCVKENMNKGWWLPGGKVEVDEKYIDAAVR